MRLEELQSKIEAIKELSLLKEKYTYRELSRLTKLPITVLHRYVSGNVLPKKERVNKIHKIFHFEFDLKKEVRKRIKIDEAGHVDSVEVMTNSFLLEKIAKQIKEKFLGKNPNKILTVESDGIPIGTHVAREFGIPCVYAKKAKDAAIKSFYEISAGLVDEVSKTFYIPKKLLSKKDRILIVDELIRTGETQKALSELAKKAGAKLIGISTIISFKKRMEKIERKAKCPTFCLVKI